MSLGLKKWRKETQDAGMQVLYCNKNFYISLYIMLDTLFTWVMYFNQKAQELLCVLCIISL